MNLLRVDLNNQTYHVKERADDLIGGRRLTSEIIAQEVDPGCHPLSPDNLLVWATGPLAGWRISCGDRLSLGSKSPLTDGIKESNSGGEVATALGGLDCRAMVVSGAFPADEPGLVIIDGLDTVRFVSAQAHWGQRLETLAANLRQEHGADYAIIAIGPAGEMLLPRPASASPTSAATPFASWPAGDWAP